jgi:Ca-activated chloride channel homolog
VRLAQLELAGFVAGQSERYTLPVQDMFVTFSTDSAAVASVDPEVMTYVQQKNIDRMINQAVGQATRNVGEARRTIQVAIGMTKRLNNPAMTKVLENALGELQRDGTISDGTRKTVVLGGKTKTIKAGAGPADEGLPSEDEIRRLSGL